jgi:Leucine-rich repeat (LRR) protein
LRPMVRFHLPFSNSAETTYRVISMYLMAQYFRNRKGLQSDWDLRGLMALYDDIHQINLHFTKRLSQIETLDTSANALTILDCFANQIQLSIDEDDLGEFEILFAPYLEGEQGEQ